MIKVHKDGTQATTKIDGISGQTTATLIRSGRIQYEFAYFKDGKRYSVWVEEFELLFNTDAEKNTIGYKTS